MPLHKPISGTNNGLSIAEGNIDILKCRIKGAIFAHQNKTHLSGKRLFVDLVRVRKSPLTDRPHSKNLSSIQRSNRMLLTQVRSSGGSSSVSDMGAKRKLTSSNESSSADPRHTLISFSIPWKTRYAGYPFSAAPYGNINNKNSVGTPHVNPSSRLDWWQHYGLRSHRKSNKIVLYLHYVCMYVCMYVLYVHMYE